MVFRHDYYADFVFLQVWCKPDAQFKSNGPAVPSVSGQKKKWFSGNRKYFFQPRWICTKLPSFFLCCQLPLSQLRKKKNVFAQVRVNLFNIWIRRGMAPKFREKQVVNPSKEKKISYPLFSKGSQQYSVWLQEKAKLLTNLWWSDRPSGGRWSITAGGKGEGTRWIWIQLLSNRVWAASIL